MQEYDRTRAFHLTNDTKQRVKAWKKDLEKQLSKFLPFESFFLLLLESKDLISEHIIQKHFQGVNE